MSQLHEGFLGRLGVGRERLAQALHPAHRLLRAVGDQGRDSVQTAPDTTRQGQTRGRQDTARHAINMCDGTLADVLAEVAFEVALKLPLVVTATGHRWKLPLEGPVKLPLEVNFEVVFEGYRLRLPFEVTARGRRSRLPFEVTVRGTVEDTF